jgi:hypothetical protein
MNVLFVQRIHTKKQKTKNKKDCFKITGKNKLKYVVSDDLRKGKSTIETKRSFFVDLPARCWLRTTAGADVKNPCSCPPRECDEWQMVVE